MLRYEIRYSYQFEKNLHLIEKDLLGFGKLQTDAYITELIASCERLSIMPQRFRQVQIKGQGYHRFNYKAHFILYRVFEPDQTVFIDTLLHSRQDVKRADI